ncbi:DedA family protein [Rhodococcus sp. 3Y1]
MKYRTFAVYNVIGGTVWGIGVPTLGYLLGGIGFVRSHIEVILILIVFLSVAPLLINALRSRQQRTTPPARRPDNASTADRDL